MLGKDGAALAELVNWAGSEMSVPWGATHEQRRVDGELRHMFRLTPAPTDTLQAVWGKEDQFFLSVVLFDSAEDTRATHTPVGSYSAPYAYTWELISEAIRSSAVLKVAHARGRSAEDRSRAVGDALGYWREHGVIADLAFDLGSGGYQVTHNDGSTNGGTAMEWWNALSTRKDWPFHV